MLAGQSGPGLHFGDAPWHEARKGGVRQLWWKYRDVRYPFRSVNDFLSDLNFVIYIKAKFIRLLVWRTLNVKQSVRLMKENKNFTLVSSIPSLEILILTKISGETCDKSSSGCLRSILSSVL